MRMNTKDQGPAGDHTSDTGAVSASKDTLHEEDGYFASYSHHSIHSDMLKV